MLELLEHSGAGERAMAGKHVSHRKEETCLWLHPAVSTLEVGKGCPEGSRQAGSLSSSQGEISPFFNVAKPFEDLKDGEKNRAMRHRQQISANPCPPTASSWATHRGV